MLVVGFVAVALWRLEQAIWGYSYESDRKKKLAQAGVSAGQGRRSSRCWPCRPDDGGSAGGGGGGQQASAGVPGSPGAGSSSAPAGLVVIGVGAMKIYEG